MKIALFMSVAVAILTTAGAHGADIRGMPAPMMEAPPGWTGCYVGGHLRISAEDSTTSASNRITGALDRTDGSNKTAAHDGLQFGYDLTMAPRIVVGGVADGCHAGGNIGYAWASDRDTETVLATGLLSPFSPTDTVFANGVKAGGYLGCDWQFASPYVIGIEGDLEWADVKGTVTFPNSGTPLNFYDMRIDNQSSVRGRVGYAFERLLLYATVGGAFGHITEHDVIGATGQFSDASATRTGLTAGAGVDIAATERRTLRIEYRYTNFGTVAYRVFTDLVGFVNDELYPRGRRDA
jgi:outer membrane immunogenic protein